MRALAILLVVAGIARADDDPAALATGPACTAKHCLGIYLHVASGDHALVVDPDWVAAQLDNANKQFAPIDAGFTVVAVDVASDMRVATPADRDRIVGKGLHDGVIDVYVTFRLDDVDNEGEVIRGVTWHKGDRKFIILSTIAPPRVLAHELGHFFGLPHSSYAISIMNKKPRTEPPHDQRRFADEEIDAMKPELARLLKAKVVVDQ